MVARGSARASREPLEGRARPRAGAPPCACAPRRRGPTGAAGALPGARQNADRGRRALARVQATARHGHALTKGWSTSCGIPAAPHTDACRAAGVSARGGLAAEAFMAGAGAARAWACAAVPPRARRAFEPRADRVMPKCGALNLAGERELLLVHLLYGSTRLSPRSGRSAQPGGDPDARPVAVGEVGLCAITRTVPPKRACSPAMAPHQVAVGVPGGLDILVHGVRASCARSPSTWLRLDLRNACGSTAVALRQLAAVPG